MLNVREPRLVDLTGAASAAAWFVHDPCMAASHEHVN